MSCPAISVVMSVFNGETFLRESIESILNQTFRDFEFLIINDGSTDKSPEILSTYAKRDARIRVIHQENKGRATSLNIGIGFAKAGYIARMDADDVALPHRFQAQIDFLERHSGVGLLGGAVELIKKSGQVIGTVQSALQDAQLKSTMLRNNPMWHPTVVMRKEVVLAAGGYRKPLLDSDDYDLFLRMGERSQLANLATIVLRYRIHSNQVSVKNMRHQTMCFLAARAAAALRQSGRPDPLCDIDAVTPQLLESLGVSAEDIQRKLLDTCAYWLQVLKKVDDATALGVFEELLQIAGPVAADRITVADAWLTAASIQCRNGKPVKAIASLGRALWLRPIVGGRPVKRALTRLAAAMKR